MPDGYAYNLALRFREVARLHAGRPALRLGPAETTSYAELDAHSNRVARLLLDLGAREGHVVAIGGDKHLDTYAAMLAALKIGAAYCILDPDNPPERLRRILSRCRPRCAVVAEGLRTKLQGVIDPQETEVIAGDRGALLRRAAGRADGEVAESQAVTGANPSYIMYTSGSTGTPKGAVMTHGSVLNLVDWSRTCYGLTPDDVLTNVNPLYFDNSVFDFYSALFNGACLAVFAREVVAQGDLLLRRLDEYCCTSWFSVPSLLIYLDTMKLLDAGRFRTLRRIIFGGEGYPKARLRRLFDLFGGRIELHNVYGPTECTCICSDYLISERDFEDLAGLPPLGDLIPNFSGLLLTEDGRAAEEGELCLLGPQVGRGYYNDPERTAAAFVQNPLNAAHHEIMYRTGDLVRRGADGLLYFLGRKDHQIKHMGYRIELEEIEAAMATLPYVKRAAAVHGMRGGVSQILGVLSCEGTVDEGAVRRDLKQTLPAYMIPTIIHFLPELPRNQNGKVDRPRLVEMFLKQA